MKKQTQVCGDDSRPAADSQTKTPRNRQAALPRKLPMNWAEKFIATEYKVVALRERALPGDLQLCWDPAQAAEYWRNTVAKNPYLNSDCECLAVLLLNTRRRVIGHQIVTIGTMDTLLLHAREVFRCAIVASAAAIILMHNHPSGDASPSEGDIRETLNLARAGELLRIEILDHIIMGQPSPGCPGGFQSLFALGYFEGIGALQGRRVLGKRRGKLARSQSTHR